MLRFRCAARLQRVAATMALLLCCLAILLSGSQADAANYATGGTGAYRGQILWLTWGGGTNGTKNAPLSNGASSSATITLNGQNLIVTCTLANITARTNNSGVTSTGGLQAYAPGSWAGDGLDNLYNIGGANTSNTLVNGIANATVDARYTFDINCTGTLNGATYKIPGVVIADAEQSRNPEYVQGTADGTWQIIEKAVNGTCAGRTYNGVLSADQRTLRLAADPATSTDCPTASSTTNYGPMGIGLLTFNNSAYQGTNAQVTINVDMNGGGKSAVAVGLLAAFIDFSDAPASYGTATHFFAPGFSQDGLSAGTTANIAATSFTLSTMNNTGRNALGTLEDSEQNGLTLNTTATADDTTGIDDEDALSGTLPTLYAAPGQTYTLMPTCTASVAIKGWIDFNINGTFDSNEASAMGTCAGGTATLNFTVPSGVKAGNSFVRLRSAFVASEIPGATGNAATGEVEDYTVNIVNPSVYVVKSYSPKTIPNDNVTTSTLTISLGNATSGPLTLASALTDNIGTGLTITSVTGGTCDTARTTYSGTTVTYASGASIPAGGCTIVATVKSATAGSYVNTIPSGALVLTGGQSNTAPTTDTLTVTLPADVSISKSGPLVSRAGNVISYTLTVSNVGPGSANGSSFQDTLLSTLTLVTATCQNFSSGTTGCAAAVDSGNQLTGNIGTLPSGGSFQILVTGTLPASAAGVISNRATTALPAGIVDPNTSNNTSNTVDTSLLDAVNDSATTVNSGAVSTVTVTSNDVIGTASATTANSSVTISANGGITGLSVSGNQLVVPASTPVGTYTVTYNLCSTVDTSICDTATAIVTVAPVPDLSLVKSGPRYARPSTSTAAVSLTYTLKVSNVSPTKASSGTVTVTDTLPTGLTATAMTGSGWTCTLATLTCTRTDALAASASYPDITVTVTAPLESMLENSAALRSFTNTARVSGGGDTISGNNTGTQLTDMVLVKLSKKVRNVTRDTNFDVTGTGLPGEVLEYCIDFNNYGGTPLENFVITDHVPTSTAALTGGYDNDEPGTLTGFGIRLIRSGNTTYLTSVSDADGGSLSTTAGNFGSGTMQATLNNLPVNDTGNVCFKASIR